MSLEGQLGTIPLPELLQLLAIGRKTGTLVIVRGETEHRIVVDSGRAVSTETGEPEIRLDRLLLRKGLIDGAALKRAKELEAASGLPLWQVLLTLQVLGEDDLREALEEKAGLLVAHLFHASDASFDFVENEVTGDGPLGLSLDLTQLVVSAAWDLERPPTAEMGATIEGVEVPGEETGQENGSPLPLSAPAAELLEEPFPEVPPTTPISVSHRRRAAGVPSAPAGGPRRVSRAGAGPRPRRRARG